MAWEEFFNLVQEGDNDAYIIWKQELDKSIFLVIKDEIYQEVVMENGRKQGHGFTWMMNSRYERLAYNSMAQNATGRVLMAGLGIGYEAYELAQRADVSEIIVVESEQKIIDLTTQYLNDPKITIIHDKVLHYLQTTSETFDTIYFDIFPANPIEFPEEVAILTNAAQPKLNTDGRILFWKIHKPLDL